MSDLKAIKLAAARKKLKDHQEKRQLPNINPSPSPKSDIPPNVILETMVTKSNESDNNHFSESILNLKTASSEQVTHTTQNYLENHSGDNGNLYRADPTREAEMFQEIQKHIKATEILVQDKRNLETKILELQGALNGVENKYSETVTALNSSKQLINRLEIEVASLNNSLSRNSQELVSNNALIENYKSVEKSLLENTVDLQEKLDVTKAALITNQTENALLQGQLQQLKGQLDLAQLRMQQLSNGAPGSADINVVNEQALLDQNRALQQKVTKMEQHLKTVELQKDQLNSHYQQYAGQLNEQLEATSIRNQTLMLENENLSNRENSLIDQMTEMEKQLQTLKSNVRNATINCSEVSTKTDMQAELSELKDQLAKKQNELQNLQNEYEGLKNQLSSSADNIAELKDVIQRLEGEKPNITKLNADIESDKVAAQRATVQNTKLKVEVNDLQDAFVKMSNDKLELTEKLQAEKYLNRELTIKLSECEEKLKEVHTKLMAKDEEMIRLQSNSNVLEKEIMLLRQEVDRLRHYEVNQTSSEALKLELENAQHTIHEANTELDIVNKNISRPIEDLEKPNEHVCSEGVKHRSLIILPAEDAVQKLQERFLRTMQEVAELSDEKQKLEHVVLQLQSETETICEYVALYQQQRGILKKREEERISQMTYLAAERERMKVQLEELRKMLTNIGLETRSSDAGGPDSKDLISKIMTTLSEIKESHLIEPDKQCSGHETFHPCPWCSGKLIEV